MGDLKTYFSSYGALADAVVMVDRRTNRSRGFGFVRFSNTLQGSLASEAVLRDFALHRLSGKWTRSSELHPPRFFRNLLRPSHREVCPRRTVWRRLRVGGPREAISDWLQRQW